MALPSRPIHHSLRERSPSPWLRHRDGPQTIPCSAGIPDGGPTGIRISSASLAPAS